MTETVMTETGCMPREKLKEYLAGWAAPEQSDLIEAHLLECTACEQTMVNLETDPETLIELVRVGGRQQTPECNSVIEAALSNSRRLMDSSSSEVVGTDAGWNPPPGDIGTYELLRPLGRGGMGSVYLARHKQLGKQVAIKLLLARPIRDDYYAARFQREVRAAGGLAHPAIVGATDAGEHQGIHFLVMEYIDGLDLSRVARACGPLPIADACEIARVVSLGLSHAHAEGIVHRDIKPSNLMLGVDGETKILDFGLAQHSLWGETSAELTTVGQLMGTLDYMAPEQAERADAVDYRADLYSLGATLFRLLCGRAPLAASPDLSPLSKLRLLATQQPPSLHTLRPDAPPELVQLVDSLLARDPAERPASAAHVAQQLAPFASGANLIALVAEATKSRAQDSVSSHAGASPVSLPDLTSLATTRSSSRGKWIRNWLAATGLALLVVFAGALVTLEMQKGQLVIDSKDADVTVKLLRNGEFYRTLRIQTGAKSTRLYAGRYEVVVDQGSDSFSVDNDMVEILSGKTSIARIRTNASNPQTNPALATHGLPASDTLLAPGDSLRLESMTDESINCRPLVLADSTVKLPYVGTVSVAGETVDSLQENLNELYRSKFINPAIEVFRDFTARRSTENVAPAAGVAPATSPVSAADQLAERRDALETELLAMERKKKELLDRTGPGHPAVRRLEALIGLLREQIATLSEYPVSEPLYEGKPLAVWLQMLGRERSPQTLGETFLAIDALLSDTTAGRITETLIEILPQLDGVGRVVLSERQRLSVDRAGFEALREANPGGAYVELLIDELRRADLAWSARVIRGGASLLTDRQEVESLVDWLEGNVMRAESASSLLYPTTQLYLELLRGEKATEALRNKILGSLDGCQRLDEEFWLALHPKHEARIGDTRLLKLIEKRAIAAFQSDGALPDRVCQAAMALTRLYKGQALTITRETENELIRAVKQRLSARAGDNNLMLATVDVRRDFAASAYPWVLPPSFNSRYSLTENGHSAWLFSTADVPRNGLRVSPTLELLELAQNLPNGDFDEELQQIAQSTQADAIRVTERLPKRVRGDAPRSVDWSRQTLNSRELKEFKEVSQQEWLAHIIHATVAPLLSRAGSDAAAPTE